jgi:hypothetical protein
VPLTLAEFDRLGIREELINVFDRAEADRLLKMIDFPPRHIPAPAATMQQYWDHVCPLLSTGVIDRDGVFEHLVAAAAELRPGNRVFRQRIDPLTAEGPDQRMSQVDRQRIDRLTVEGPDQRMFQVEDIPFEALVEHIVRGILNHYDGQLRQDQQGQRRRWVIDVVQEDGGARRLDPRATLRENGLQSGDTVQVSPEAVAGLSHEEALVTVRRDVNRFLDAHPQVEASVNFPEWAPTQYLLRFEAPGFAPAISGGPPRFADRHEVFIDIPPEFPAEAPVAFWQTPIFHPNVRGKDGWVCLGELQKGYRPAMDFGLVLQALIDIASYRNYNVSDAVNPESRAWALLEEGQEAIKRRGGRTIAELEGEGVDPMPEFTVTEIKTNG